jgi:alpha-mannosidase
MFGKRNGKKEVIAYLHTHWDREWYREFEVFRLRLVRVFDHILDMLEEEKIPSFYFDGQVIALLDYLKFRPEKEDLVRELISKKKLFIGPFYCLADEFLTDGICFRKNLEIGLKIARDFGCNDFVAYLADTFGHSQNIPEILTEFDIDKAIVWRGCGDIPANFKFGSIDTVNLIRGYFNDIFSLEKSIKEKAELLELNLDKISEQSGNTLLLPIGADHLDVPDNIETQIERINEYLEDYEIKLGTIFDYFNAVKFKGKHTGELRDNSKTFILPGTYSSRLNLKRLNTECSYKLDLADKIQYNFGSNYDSAIEYAYKLLLQNQAHDSICGCSTDLVHQENVIRYQKVLQIADTIINEIRQTQEKNLTISFKYIDKYKLLEVDRTEIEPGSQVIAKRNGFPPEILYDTNKIPVTEDYTTIYTLLKEFNPDNKQSDLVVDENCIFNSNIKLEVSDGKINVYDKSKKYENFIEFVRAKDKGDSYNFGPVPDEGYEVAQIKSSKVIMDGPLRSIIRIVTSFFSVDITLDKRSKLLKFKIKWLNMLSNRIWQVRFNLPKKVKEVHSEDMNMLISRKFDPEYNIRQNLPKSKGLEAKTNTAPMQRFAWTNGLGVITKGLTEYEVCKNYFSITLLRSTGVISNPQNPARTTPAGPPIEVPGLQMIGENTAEFAIGFFPLKDWANYVEDIYPQTVIF